MKYRRLTPATSCTVVFLGSALSSLHATAAPATAPFWGQTGLGIIPTTQTVPPKSGEVGIGYERIRPEDGRTRFAPVISAVYGFEKGEVGAGYLNENTSISGFDFKTKYKTFFGKYRVYEGKRGLKAAVGVHYLDFDGSSGSVTSLYAAGSAPLGQPKDGRQPVLLHFGVMGQRAKTPFDSNTEIRPFGGLEYFATPEISVAGDYVPRKGQNVSLKSLAVRYQAPSGLGAQIGVGEFRDNDAKFFVGLSYRFGQLKGAR